MPFPLLKKVEIPGAGHPGSFGFRRKNHIHEGVDLYGQPDDPVRSIEYGFVLAIYPFTGEQVGMPWWHNTDAIAIVDENGIWVYGEIEVDEHLKFGDFVEPGQPLGKLKTVLKKDKGRPMTMLHIERWKLGTMPYTFLWELDQPQPEFLLDPTPLLLRE